MTVKTALEYTSINAIGDGVCSGYGVAPYQIGDPITITDHTNYDFNIVTNLETENLKVEIALLRAEIDDLKRELEEERQKVSADELAKAKDALKDILK